jgi:uncharacterized Zn finger protein
MSPRDAADSRRDREERDDLSRYGKPIRVEGGIRAQSTRGAIGESWWSRRFIAVLESFPGLGGRLGRGRSYARAGQVLDLRIAPGLVTSTVQGSRRDPYRVQIGLSMFDSPTWTAIEQAMAGQALFLARLLAGEMPQQIEEAFAAAGTPLFPASREDLRMSCSCPDPSVPCKHLAATFYLLAETFDADPFEILHWRGRDRATLLANLRALRGASSPRATKRRSGAAGKRARGRTAPPSAVAGIGATAALGDLTGPSLEESVGRFWVAPVPLPPRPATLSTDVDLVLRQLPQPDATLGGAALRDTLSALYQAFRPAGGQADPGVDPPISRRRR